MVCKLTIQKLADELNMYIEERNCYRPNMVENLNM